MPLGVRAFTSATFEGISMAQLLMSWFICDGAFRVHAINAVGRRKGCIIEVEEVDTRERFHGSARRMERLVHMLRRAYGELDNPSAWTPNTTS
jgi:hypothetical protein